MNLYLRLLFLILVAAKRPKIFYKDTLVSGFRVLLTDLDLNKHMNNARYLSIMDLGRIEFMLRSGLLKVAIERKWAPVVANIDISYYKSLHPWEKYQLETSLEGHDDKYLYMRQTFKRLDGTKVASAKVKGLFLKGKEKVSPNDVLAVLDA